MTFWFFNNLFRCLKGSSSTQRRYVAPPPLCAWCHIYLHKPDCGDASNVAAKAAERMQNVVVETFKHPFPELANISGASGHNVKLTIPQGLDLDGVTWGLRRAPSFDWEKQGETVVRDEFNAHNIHYKPTFFDSWRTKAETLRRRITRKQGETLERATQWMESFLSGPDPSLFSHILSSVDMSTIWDRLVYCIDAALDGQSLDEPSSPAKESSPQPYPLFFTLGVFDVPEGEDLTLRMYSVRLTGWADFRAEDGLLRSGIKGELKCVDYKVPSFS